jgi:hypothetical protein
MIYITEYHLPTTADTLIIMGKTPNYCETPRIWIHLSAALLQCIPITCTVSTPLYGNSWSGCEAPLLHYLCRATHVPTNLSVTNVYSSSYRHDLPVPGCSQKCGVSQGSMLPMKRLMKPALESLTKKQRKYWHIRTEKQKEENLAFKKFHTDSLP